MKKIIVIGCPGSGKSTFSRKLKNITGLPLYHLDLLYWNKDKTTVSKEEFINRLKKAMEEACWIIDGNYKSTMEMRFKECDTVFFLDFPVEVCLEGIEARKGVLRSDMPWVENGQSDDEFIGFVKNFNNDSRPEIIDLIKKYDEKNIIVFHSREECQKFLSSLT